VNYNILNKKIRVLFGTLSIFEDHYNPQDRASNNKARRVQLKTLSMLLDDMEVSIDDIRAEIENLKRRG